MAMHRSGFRLAGQSGRLFGTCGRHQRAPRAGAGEAVVERNGLKLFLPAESRILLDGVTIDFADTPSQTGLVVQGSEAGFLLEPLDGRH